MNLTVLACESLEHAAEVPAELTQAAPGHQKILQYLLFQTAALAFVDIEQELDLGQSVSPINLRLQDREVQARNID